MEGGEGGNSMLLLLNSWDTTEEGGGGVVTKQPTVEFVVFIVGKKRWGKVLFTAYHHRWENR